MPMSEPISVITPIPDRNTSESIMYGSAYLFGKSATYYWDSVEDQLRREIAQLKHLLRDDKFCSWVVNVNPMLMFMPNPPVDTIEKIRDLRTLKEIVKRGTSLREVEVRRTENQMYSQLVGISEYSGKMLESGISDKMWKSATIGFDLPIEYDTVRSKKDEDEKLAYYESEDLVEAEKQFKERQMQLAREYEEYLAEKAEAERIANEEPEEVELNIFREIEEPNEELPEKYNIIADYLAEWSRNPIVELIEYLDNENERAESDENDEPVFKPEITEEVPEEIWDIDVDRPQSTERIGLLKLLFSNRAGGRK